MSELFNVQYPNASTASLTSEEIARQFKAGTLPTDAVIVTDKGSVPIKEFVDSHSTPSVATSLPKPSLPKPSIPTPSIPKPSLSPRPTSHSQVIEEANELVEQDNSTSESTQPDEATEEIPEPELTEEDQEWVRGLMKTTIPFYGFYQAILLKLVADEKLPANEEDSVKGIIPSLLWIALGIHVASYFMCIFFLCQGNELCKAMAVLASPIGAGLTVYLLGWVAKAICHFGLSSIRSVWFARLIAAKIMAALASLTAIQALCTSIFSEELSNILNLIFVLGAFGFIIRIFIKEKQRSGWDDRPIFRVFLSTCVAIALYSIISTIIISIGLFMFSLVF
jgi:hypothetical protein